MTKEKLFNTILKLKRLASDIETRLKDYALMELIEGNIIDQGFKKKLQDDIKKMIEKRESILSIPTEEKPKEEIINHGDYCYNSFGICPYWFSDPTKMEQEDGVCLYLNIKDSKNDQLTFLWDQVRECSYAGSSFGPGFLFGGVRF
jgi:DNA mismatch repair ATPase MutS